MKALRSLALLITFLSIVSTALAISPITLEIEDFNEIISSDESATFVLNVNNNQDDADNFYVSAPKTNWDVSFEDYYLQIESGQTKSTLVRITPPLTVPVGKYGVYFEVKSATDSKIMEYRYVHITVNETLAPPPVIEEPEIIEKEPLTELTITEEASDETFFKRSYSFLLENTGETIIEDQWEGIFSELDILLLSSIPEKTTITDYGDQKKVFWAYTLSPGESLRISYSVSYYPIFAAIGFIGLALVMFMFYYSSSFKVSKAISKSKLHEKVLRVDIIAVNKTRQTKKGVIVEDYIPIPFDLVKHFDTIEPDSVSKHGSYLKVKWKIPEVAPKEERIFTYYVKSKLKVVGAITLPQAVLSYKRGKGTSRAYSGTLKVIGKDIA